MQFVALVKCSHDINSSNMRTLLFIPVILFLWFALFSDLRTNQTANVYICDSSGAYAYHYKKNCPGIKRCTHNVKMVSLADARRRYKRKLCGWED